MQPVAKNSAAAVTRSAAEALAALGSSRVAGLSGAAARERLAFQRDQPLSSASSAKVLPVQAPASNSSSWGSSS